MMKVNKEIVDSYINAFGEQVYAREQTIDLISKALGTSNQGLKNIAILEDSYFFLDLPCEKLIWKIFQNRTIVSQGELERIDNGFHFNLNLPIGYYDLELSNLEHTLLLVSAPKRAYLPEDLKRWGVTAQLYALEKNGFGDFQTLSKFKEITRKAGGAFIGLNPLLATGFPKNVGISPYSPVSRFALNELYISTDLPELGNPKVDYEKIAEYKNKILYQKFCHYNQAPKINDRNLLNYASYSVLRDNFGSVWQQWPKQYQDPSSREVLEYLEQNKKQVDYYLYLQTLAKAELSKLCTKNFDQAVLYLDFPVGVSLNSSDVWSDQSLYALAASAGAPPDELAPQGQSWGLAPMIPEQLLERSCRPFIEALRFTMQFAGAIRIDHVMSLWRLYWSMPNGDGAYVKYPARELTSIVKLESHLNQCVVIGEDLGTVPEETKEFMSSSGVLSYKVFYFEKNTDGFKSPKDYPKESLCCVGTHDLPTLRGYFEKHDLKERKELCLHQEDVLLRLERVRDLDLVALKKMLEADNLEQILRQVYSKLAHGNSMLMAIQVEDLCLQLEQVNLPGTVSERANWKKTISLSLKELEEKLLELKSAI